MMISPLAAAMQTMAAFATTNQELAARVKAAQPEPPKRESSTPVPIYTATGEVIQIGRSESTISVTA